MRHFFDALRRSKIDIFPKHEDLAVTDFGAILDKKHKALEGSGVASYSYFCSGDLRCRLLEDADNRETSAGPLDMDDHVWRKWPGRSGLLSR